MNFKFKDFLIPLSFAFLITLFCQYMFFNENSDAKANERLESGRSKVAPRIQEVHRPLNLEIDFLDSKPSIEEKITVINTDFAKFLFSNYGASIVSAEFKHSVSGKDQLIKTINATAKEDRCLLVAFNEKTPFYYKLVNQNEAGEIVLLSYAADFNGGKIFKNFRIYKQICQIDLEIIIEPNKTFPEDLRLRILYPSPLPLDVNDVIQGVFNESNNIVKRTMPSLLERYWEIPTLFGLEDRYFVHAMIKDSNNFTQRGYFKSMGINSYFSILEGPAVKDKSLWSLSFYFGPKKSSNLFVVDPRLEKTLDYGYLAIVAKPLLSILVFIYGFVHNYGIAIILLTILIKLLLLPFTLRGEQSMKKRIEFQKKLQYIQQKYKDDKHALAQARAELLKKHGMADMAGCWPLLLQFPIFFALNRVLTNSIELYHEPFLWIPNLSAKDPLYILPILIGISMILHSLFTATDAKQRLSTFAIALLFSAFSAGLPSGLSLFIFVSAALSVVQTKLYTMFKKQA